MNRLAFRCSTTVLFGAFLLSAVVSAQTSLIVDGSDTAKGHGDHVTKVSGPVENTKSGGVSIARCGDTLVAGFGDQEASQPNSQDGFSVSKNGGASFKDLGVLPPSSDPGYLLGLSQSGNPAVACSDDKTFYYASVAYQGLYNYTTIAVSKSTNGGTAWNPPISASYTQMDIDAFSWPSIAVDPSDSQRIYVAYLDDNSAGPFDFADCSGPTMILEFAASADGGKTWNGDPGFNVAMQLDHGCYASYFEPLTGTIKGPDVAVGPGGEIYIAYEFITAGPSPVNEIRFVRSLDHGATFSSPMIISTSAIANIVPKLAVDRTSSAHRGELFLVWPGSQNGTSTNILVSDSLNKGQTFSFPRPIVISAVTSSHYQVKPSIGADKDGEVAVCYENTPTNHPMSASVYSHYCALSFNHAATWQDTLVDAGTVNEYGGLASDFSLHYDSFFTAFSVNTKGVRYVVGASIDSH